MEVTAGMKKKLQEEIKLGVSKEMKKLDLKIKCNTQLLDPDRDLLCWEKWIRIRNDEAKYLASRTQRPAVDLTMNLLEKEHEDIERKTALVYAQVPKIPKIRDNTPWDRPERLYQYCDCEPVYELHRKPAEMGSPPVLEHIGVPTYIQVEEKGLFGEPTRKLCTQLDADYIKYREKRELELKRKIKKIDPFRSDISELMIKGKKAIQPPPVKLPPLPEINIDLPEVENDFVDSIYAVRINNTVVLKDIPGQNLSHLRKMQEQPWHEHCLSWTYYFNVPIKRAGRSKMYLENLGTTTLRYCWKRIRRPIPFMPLDFYVQVFFFNKNEDVLSPGQSKEIFLTYISDQPGIHSEIWELSFCNICFFDTLSAKFILNLVGDAVENIDKTIKKTEALKRKICKKALYDNIKNILDEIVAKATAIEPQIYPYKKWFLEAEMFLMKNPVCYYHQTEVKKMKDLYLEMEPGEEWNLSIVKWREAMLKKNFEERMKYYELLRKSHSDLLKPWLEGDELLKQKHQAVGWLLGQLADKFVTVQAYIYDSLYQRRESQVSQSSGPKSSSRILDSVDSDIRDMASVMFVTHMTTHVEAAIESIAGVLSSLDLNRWIEFDFCRL
ncbi:MYCBP-associated protein-like [Plodia interpunctella]|uniref:MYCBP-associated protein-like n=1 Tax=Plodia interpunctella TaxID=58824 RepID=UPI002367FF7F|nr:MYCBP-associated protein-like [Plodia interpunctella]